MTTQKKVRKREKEKKASPTIKNIEKVTLWESPFFMPFPL